MKISFDDPDGESAMGAAKISKTKKCQWSNQKYSISSPTHVLTTFHCLKWFPTNKPVHTHHA